MDYLNNIQKRILIERNPDNNKSLFFDRVSKITITEKTDQTMINLFANYQNLIDAKIIFKGA